MINPCKEVAGRCIGVLLVTVGECSASIPIFVVLADLHCK
jgi:hypothetical protein